MTGTLTRTRTLALSLALSGALLAGCDRPADTAGSGGTGATGSSSGSSGAGGTAPDEPEAQHVAERPVVAIFADEQVRVSHTLV